MSETRPQRRWRFSNIVLGDDLTNSPIEIWIDDCGVRVRRLDRARSTEVPSGEE